jgi:hypothetical protein
MEHPQGGDWDRDPVHGLAWKYDMNPVLDGRARSGKVRPSSKPSEDGIYGDGKESVFKIMFMENSLLFSERFPWSADWILPGEGKWLRPASGCCASWLLPARKMGFNGSRNQPNSLSPRWNTAK